MKKEQMPNDSKSKINEKTDSLNKYLESSYSF